jgi:hypothetical protein
MMFHELPNLLVPGKEIFPEFPDRTAAVLNANGQDQAKPERDSLRSTAWKTIVPLVT